MEEDRNQGRSQKDYEINQYRERQICPEDYIGRFFHFRLTLYECFPKPKILKDLGKPDSYHCNADYTKIRGGKNTGENQSYYRLNRAGSYLPQSSPFYR